MTFLAWAPSRFVHGGLAALVLAWAPACGDPGPAGGSWGEAFDASETGWLLNVGGPDGGPLWAVGGEPEQGVIMERGEQGWAPKAIGLDVPLLNWTHAFGPDDRFVVGNAGTVLRYGGSGFERMDTPTTEDLWGVWGASPDDVWAVGGSGRPDSEATILRFDGGGWEEVTLPPLMRSGVRAFFKVWGTGPDDVWVVGQGGVVLQWDGLEWTEHLVGASDDLIALWGTGPERIVIVGGRGNGVVSVWDGSEWRTDNLAPLPGLNGVWMRRDGVAHLAGIEGTLATLQVDTFEWTLAETGTRTTFHSVFGDASGALHAVGGNLSSASGPYRGIAYTRRLGADE